MKFITTLIILFFIGYGIEKAISSTKKEEVPPKPKLVDSIQKRVNLLSIENAKKRIKDLGLPDFYIDVLNKHKIHKSLEYFCQFPYWLYSDENFVQDFSNILGDYDEVIPLCEEGDITALIAIVVKENTVNFIHMIYESPNSYQIYNSRQALLVDLFIRLWEMSDAKKNSDLKDLHKIAKEIDFKHVDELNELLWNYNESNYKQRDLAIKQFKQKLDKK